MKVLEVVNGSANKFLFSGLKLFNNSEIINMAFLMNVGKIKDVDKNTKRNVCGREIILKKNIDNFKLKVLEFKNIRIWYSSVDPEEECFFLFVVYLINKISDENLNVSAINVGKIGMQSPLCSSKNEIKNLFELEEYLNKKEIGRIATKWKMLMLENADLRLIVNSEIKSFPFEYLDYKILELLAKYSEIDKHKFIVKCVSEKLCSIMGDLIFEYRINELIKENKIKVVSSISIKNLFGKKEQREIITSDI